jgi:hypothetical protein
MCAAVRGRDASCAQLECVLPLLQSARHRLPWFIQGPLCPPHSDSTAISPSPTVVITTRD